MSRAPGIVIRPKNPLEILIELLELLIKLILLPFRIIKKIFQWLFHPSVRPLPPRKRRPFLSRKVKIKAHSKFRMLLSKFRREHGREPTKDELFPIIIKVSHMTIRGRSKRGHWGRQKIRKMLLEENGIPYTMR